MQTLPTDVATSANIPRGQEPVTLIKIDWVTGSVWYADKATPIPTELGIATAEGRISSFASVSTQAKVGSLGTVSSSSLTLLDYDGALFTIMTTSRILGCTVTVYQYFEGNIDAAYVLGGRINGPISYDEATRVLNLGIDTTIAAADVGYQAYEDGPIWPIVFGDCIRVPAVELDPTAKGTLQHEVSWVQYLATGTIIVNGGSEFPQDTNIMITISNKGPLALICHGSFSGNVFTPTTVNSPIYENIGFLPREITDPDYVNPSVAWVPAGVNLVGLFCWVKDSQSIVFETGNFCVRQEGNKCWFYRQWSPWSTLITFFPNSATEIQEATQWSSHRYTDAWQWWWFIANGVPAGGMYSHSDPWIFSAGSDVYYNGIDVTYICNQAPSDEILEVMAYRNVDGENLLVPVPSSYFTIKLEDSENLNATSIHFNRRLSLRNREGWSDGIFVTLRSSLSSNIADVLTWIIEEHTSLLVDMASHADVASKCLSYPANFAVLNRQDALALASDVAYQARCAILQRGQVVIMKYLSFEATSGFTLSDTNILRDSVQLSTTELMDIQTDWEATWQPDYAEDALEVGMARNVDIFGKIEQSINIRIYNIHHLVMQSLGFWCNRYSNGWRRFKASTNLQALPLEGYDIANQTLYGDIRGEVEQINVDTLTGQVDVDLWLASKDGSALVEDLSFWYGDSEYPISPYDEYPDDPLAGRSLVDYVIPLDPEDPKTPPDAGENAAEILGLPNSVARGVPFSITVTIYDGRGRQIDVYGNVNISISSYDSDDVLDITAITLSNGTWTGDLTITGGSGPGAVSVIIADTDIFQGTASQTIPIDPYGEARLETPPTLVLRDGLFTAKIIWGTPNGDVTVGLLTSDTDTLVDEDGDPVSIITLDGNGEYLGTWQLTGGTVKSSPFQIRITDEGVIYDSPNAICIGGFAYLDVLQAFTKTQYNQLLALGNVSGTVALDLDASNNQQMTITGTTTLTVTSTPRVGSTGILEITTAAARDVTWGTGFVTPDDADLTIDAAGNYIFAYYIRSDGAAIVTPSCKVTA